MDRVREIGLTLCGLVTVYTHTVLPSLGGLDQNERSVSGHSESIRYSLDLRYIKSSVRMLRSHILTI